MSEERAGRRSWSLWTVLGWTSIGLFVLIHAVELLPHHGRPVTLAWIDEHLGTGGLTAKHSSRARYPQARPRAGPLRPNPVT